ncbi:hypothetical protein PCE1_001538 [Barthelona sp. PCE]
MNKPNQQSEQSQAKPQQKQNQNKDPEQYQNNSCVYNLTRKLLANYCKINELYYSAHDDNNGYLRVSQNAELSSGRFRITGKKRLGKGSFGEVWKAFDSKENQNVALKILRKRKHFAIQGANEAALLAELSAEYDVNDVHIVSLLGSLYISNHFCLILELLDKNLYQIYRSKYKSELFPLNAVIEVTKQLLQSLKALHNYNPPIIHTDLKPENILSVGPWDDQNPNVKIVDLGSAMKCDEPRKFNYVQSRYYRAPEILLRCHDNDYTTAIDIWSLGCVIVEMILRQPLFKGHNSAQMVSLIDSTLGEPPKDMRIGKDFAKYYNDLPEDEESDYEREHCLLSVPLTKHHEHPRILFAQLVERTEDYRWEVLGNMVERMIQWRADDRMSATDLLNYMIEQGL